MVPCTCITVVLPAYKKDRRRRKKEREREEETTTTTATTSKVRDEDGGGALAGSRMVNVSLLCIYLAFGGVLRTAK